MEGPIDWRATTFGILLDYSMLLIYCDLRAVTHKNLDDRVRQRSMWTFNGGIALAAFSMFGITLIGPV